MNSEGDGRRFRFCYQTAAREWPSNSLRRDVSKCATQAATVRNGTPNPSHAVELDAFWIGVDPVTNGQFQAFAAATGYQTIRERRPTERPFWTDFASPGREDYPLCRRQLGYRVPRGGCWENQNFGLHCCERIFARANTRNKPLVSGFR
jgi:formylglycine-generating enzyme required for sulfatase activity